MKIYLWGETSIHLQTHAFTTALSPIFLKCSRTHTQSLFCEHTRVHSIGIAQSIKYTSTHNKANTRNCMHTYTFVLPLSLFHIRMSRRARKNYQQRIKRDLLQTKTNFVLVSPISRTLTHISSQSLEHAHINTQDTSYSLPLSGKKLGQHVLIQISRSSTYLTPPFTSAMSPIIATRWTSSSTHASSPGPLPLYTQQVKKKETCSLPFRLGFVLMHL